MSRGTTRRTIRIANGLWEAALAVAAERGEKLPDVIRRALWDYTQPQPATEEEPKS